MKFFLLVTFFISVGEVTSAQKYIYQLNEYFKSVSDGKNPVLQNDVLNDRKNEDAILSVLARFANDSTAKVRYSAYTLMSEVGRRSLSPSIRRHGVTLLVRGWKDIDSGINGHVGSLLQNFKPTDFDGQAQDSIRTLAKKIPPYYDKLVKLIGYLAINDQQSVIQAHLQTGIIKNETYQWAAYLALFRLGNRQAMGYVMQRVRRLGINDDVVYDVLPDLIYTRRREAIAYVVESLYSDENNCESPNPEVIERIPCAYRMIEILAPVIQDFPFKIDGGGDLEVRDYKTTLTQLRGWFRNHQEYEILSN